MVRLFMVPPNGTVWLIAFFLEWAFRLLGFDAAVLRSRGRYSGHRSAPEDVGIDCDDDDRSRDHDLPFLRHGQDPKAIGRYADDQSADQGAQHGAAAAAE